MLLRKRGLVVYLSKWRADEGAECPPSRVWDKSGSPGWSLGPSLAPHPPQTHRGPSSCSSLCPPSWLCIQSTPHKCLMQRGDEQQWDTGWTGHRWCLVSALNACPSPAPAEPRAVPLLGSVSPVSPQPLPRGWGGRVSVRRGLLGRGSVFQSYRPSDSSPPGLGPPRQGSLILS